MYFINDINTSLFNKMPETSIFKKNKINLDDYDYQRDIKNRLLLSRFSSEYIQILEEIVYGSPIIPLSLLVQQVGKTYEELQTILQKLSETDLFKIENQKIIVNKENRKYFATQIIKFDKKFIPGVDFLRALLKKVPIPVLLNWYPIPRTSDNIFDSLIEKYLGTPQTFQRYLSELNLENQNLNGIVNDLLNSKNYKIYSEDLRKKYMLSKESFEKHILYLEFNFLCCLIYEKKDGEWVEVVSLFQEWQDYLRFLKKTQPKKIEKKSQIHRTRPNDFAFVEDMSIIIELAITIPLYVRLNNNENWMFDKQSINHIIKRVKGFDLHSEEGNSFLTNYFVKIIQKLLFLKFSQIQKGELIIENDAKEWLALPTEKKALNIYNHTLKHLNSFAFPSQICNERNFHEITKTIKRILNAEWVFLDDFLQGIIAPISEKSKMMLKKKGGYWAYTLPDYSDKEIRFFKKVYECLFETGLITTGSYQGKTCLKITPFGQFTFG